MKVVKKLTIISALLLIASNGWAFSPAGTITRAEAEKKLEEIKNYYDTNATHKVIAFGIGKNNTLAYAVCTNRDTMQAAKDCAEQACLLRGSDCKFVAINKEFHPNPLIMGREFGSKLGWNLGQSNSPKKTAAKQPATKKTSVEFGNITLAQLQRGEFPGEDDYARSGMHKALALGVGNNNNIAYAFCANHTTLSKAIACAKQACLRRSNHCEIIQTNSDETYEPSAKFVQEVRRNLGQSNNQTQLSNNQSQQPSMIELCLERQVLARKNYVCSSRPTKQGGIRGFATQYNQCQSERQRMFPDSVCFGAKPPDPLPPPKQVCNFECNGGIIVQGNCNKSSITVGNDEFGFINVCRRMY